MCGYFCVSCSAYVPFVTIRIIEIIEYYELIVRSFKKENNKFFPFFVVVAILSVSWLLSLSPIIKID